VNYPDFSKLLSETRAPVVLLEGTRELPAEQAPRLTALAAHLARTFPHARFRTGNAKGSDEAFAAGVASVDPNRIEFVLPYAGHRSSYRPAESQATTIDDVPGDRLQEVVNATVAASPQHERVAVNYRKKPMPPRQRATAQLLLRDTLKVTGSEAFQKPVAGVFFVHAPDPDRGGTGHTIRVCRRQGVPVITQFDWLGWNLEGGPSSVGSVK
jgi:hypothetical protein